MQRVGQRCPLGALTTELGKSSPEASRVVSDDFKIGFPMGITIKTNTEVGKDTFVLTHSVAAARCWSLL